MFSLFTGAATASGPLTAKQAQLFGRYKETEAISQLPQGPSFNPALVTNAVEAHYQTAPRFMRDTRVDPNARRKFRRNFVKQQRMLGSTGFYLPS